MTAQPLRDGDPNPATSGGRGERLLVDELSEQLSRTRSLLTAGPESVAERALDHMGSQAEAEGRVAAERAVREPLAQPDRFPEAHQLVMQALEVLDRHGSSGAHVKHLWFLAPLAEQLIERVAGFIAGSYAKSII